MVYKKKTIKTKSIQKKSKKNKSCHKKTTTIKTNACIAIQRMFRGHNLRKNRLPLIMYSIKNYLSSVIVDFSRKTSDGRINSCIDEKIILDLLLKKFKSKIKIPKIRMWYDFSIYDNILLEYIPINIKTTNTFTHDNTGNLAMCVHAYTNETLDIERSYNNGKMSKILIDKIKKKHWNNKHKKDYYFLVLNKNNSNDIIINSLKGLNVLTPNAHNLPFQVCWDKNRIFTYKNTNKCVELFINCLKRQKPTWKDSFIKDINGIKNLK